MIAPAFSQKRVSAIYQHTCDFLDAYPSSANSTSEIEIQLIGTFHFKSKKWTVAPIEQEILDFQPSHLFVEEVPPQGAEGYTKEAYKNELYTSSKRGKEFYSNGIDSAVAFTGISRAQAPMVIAKSKELLKNDPNDLNARIALINALYINADDSNALLQLVYLRKFADESKGAVYDSLLHQISPIHRKYRFAAGETKYLSVPVAASLHHNEIIPMDYQVGRTVNDSLLSIASRGMMPKLLGRFWQLPYFIKMMKMDKNDPKNDQEAVKYYRTLNEFKAIKNVAKLHEIYLYNPKIEASQIWIESYRKRNREMVASIRKKIVDGNIKKATIIVGAGHVPYFLYELNQQLPKARIILLKEEK